MSIETLMGGVESYTSLAEVAEATDSDVPEGTPTIIVSGLGSFNASYGVTMKIGC